LTAGLRLADYFEVVLEFEHCANTLSDDRMVFREQDSDPFHQNSMLRFTGLHQ
jgi:hypothetical protein